MALRGHSSPMGIMIVRADRIVCPTLLAPIRRCRVAQTILSARIKKKAHDLGKGVFTWIARLPGLLLMLLRRFAQMNADFGEFVVRVFPSAPICEHLRMKTNEIEGSRGGWMRFPFFLSSFSASLRLCGRFPFQYQKFVVDILHWIQRVTRDVFSGNEEFSRLH